jgi:hypothetical protein
MSGKQEKQWRKRLLSDLRGAQERDGEPSLWDLADQVEARGESDYAAFLRREAARSGIRRPPPRA